VSSLPAQVGTAVALFAGTNVDDLVILSLLSAASTTGGRPRRWEIWAGQYLGLAALTGVALAAGRGLARIPEQWLWLLALIPIGLGVVSLIGAIRALRRGERPEQPSAGGALGVAGLTIANGADNLAAYTPFFATAGWGQITVTLAVFAAGVDAWCLAGGLLARHGAVTAAVARYGHWILPAVFILIGLYVLHKTGGPIRL
jgi:cadmium resistance protein CadD (predicted permease)